MFAAGTGGKSSAPQPPAPMQPAADAGASNAGPLRLESDVYHDGEPLDPRYRCPGPSPDLRWSGAPAGTQGFALVMRDRSNSFLHWLIYDIPGSVTRLPEGVSSGATLDEPAGAKQGRSYNGNRGYVGPCGRNNNPYEMTLYALDVAVLPDLGANASNDGIIAALDEHELETVQVTAMSGPN